MTRRGTKARNRSVNECTTATEDVADFKPLFADLFSGATYEHVDPHACIPFTKIRQMSPSGVQRLICLFDNTGPQPQGVITTGLAHGSATPILIKLEGSLSSSIYTHFKEEGFYGDDLDAAVNKRDVWYGIIDGYHSNLAVRWLTENKPHWKHYSWFVTVLRGGNSVERYKQLARFQNHRHSPRYNIRMTFYDELSNLRSEFNRLSSSGSKPSNLSVAQSYFGTTETSRTMTMLASTAVRLPMAVIETIGKITNSEHPELCTGQTYFENYGAGSTKEAESWLDCRLYKSFIRLQSLYGSTVFMNPSSEMEKQAQVNTLYRVQLICRERGFRTVQHSDVSAQFKASVLALKEAAKFLKYINRSKWPDEMDTIRLNLLQSMKLDDEVTSNQGNEYSVIESLRSALQRVDPDLRDRSDALLITRTECSAQQSTNGFDNANTETTSNPPCNSKDDNGVVQNNQPQVNTDVPDVPNPSAQSNEGNGKMDIDKEERQTKIDELNSIGIQFINKTWQEYRTTAHKADTDQVNFIITEPPSSPSRSFIHSVRANSDVSRELGEDEINDFGLFCKEALLPGGYVVIFLPFYSYSEWYNVFHKIGFDIMPYPYVIMFDSKSIQNRNPSIFPQNSALYALLCHLPGPSKHGQFNTSFHLINCQNSRNLAGMFNVQFPKSPLRRPGTKVPFNANELPVDMLCEIIDLFCPHRGKVMDPYSGTMTTLIASIRTGRKCLGIEKTTDLYNAALERLFGFLPSSTSLRRTSEPSPSLKFEHDLKASGTEANLLLNITTPSSPNLNETDIPNMDEDDGPIMAVRPHPQTITKGRHSASVVVQEPEGPALNNTVKQFKPTSSSTRKMHRRGSKRQESRPLDISANQPGQIKEMPHKKARVGLVKNICQTMADNVKLSNLTQKIW